MILGLLTQAVGLGLNYIFTLTVVYISDTSEAGRIFWYVNLLFALSLLTSWGTDTWLVRDIATVKTNLKGQYNTNCRTPNDAVQRSFHLSAVVLTAITPIICFYIIWIENDGFKFTVAFLSALAGYTLLSTLSAIHQGLGQRASSMYFRAVAPYIFAVPYLLIAAKFGNATLDYALSGIALSALINIIAFSGPYFRNVLRIQASTAEIVQLLKIYAPNIIGSLLGFLAAWYVLFVGKFFLNDEEIAQISFVMKIASIVSIPMVVVCVAMSRSIVRATSNADLRRLYVRSIFTCLIVGAPIYVALISFAGNIFESLKPAYSLRSELLALATAQLGVMAFGAQTAVLAMTGRIAGLNLSMVLTIVIGAVVVLGMGRLGGVTPIIYGVSAVLLVQPAIGAFILFRDLREPTNHILS